MTEAKKAADLKTAATNGAEESTLPLIDTPFFAAIIESIMTFENNRCVLAYI